MNPGALRHRITLQKKETGTNDEGLPAVQWTDFATVSAAVEPLRGREYFAAAAANAESTVRVRIRYRQGVTSDMRVLYNGRTLEIQSPPIDPNERHRELHLMCREVKGNG
ncbi:phage head closure protein [Paenibacillus chitinolyticus]|uniref:phage head closure protein n=1 Tax=Paenibacillus chitinolyticus TaxID=79263 RepID=UPI002DB94917|nr:phage head closure protein [Paenibacillus chitinolyticus]MEC0248891.1 phage head closure protein [Paenibacillus chitinolyticus]